MRQDNNRRLLWGLTYAKNKRTSWEPFSALRLYKSEIAKRLSTDIHFSASDNAQDAVRQLKEIEPDVLLICSTWDIGCEEIKHLIHALSAVGSVKKMVFIDPCDGTCTPYLPLLGDVDLYVKPHSFRDSRMYLDEYFGGYIFTDFLVKRLGWELNGWHFGSCARKENMGKLRVGWSYGVSRRNCALARLSSLLPMPWAFRRTDVNRRFCPVERGAQEWYARYRRMASRAVETLGGRVRISGYERIKYKRYLLELMNTKIALSPFGWGEICIRDYEAIACGALLIKPDVRHVQTKPDIFRANETYVPVKWDFSDLAEKADYFLSHPGEARQIALAGRKSLLKYFKQRQFLEDFRDCLDGLDTITT